MIKTCQNCKTDFIIEGEDLGFYKKIDVPPPTFCPECRRQRRLTWRNDINLYSRSCGLCKKSIVSIYSPNKPSPVYCQKCWWSDQWDPKDYAKDYDFSKPFFVQFKELYDSVPALALVNDDGIGSVNCEYTQDFAFSKNCYMSFIGWKAEDCLYDHYVVGGKELVDCSDSMGGSELTYENIYTEQCYQCKYVYYSASCSNCAFCYDCKDCSDCFMSVGLRHKKYYFKNQPYQKEEYEKIVAEYKLDAFSGVSKAKEEFMPFFLQYPRKYANMKNCANCTGDAILNGKNSQHCFNVQRPEDSKYIQNSDTPKDCYDLSVGGELNQCYEGITPDHSYRAFFSIFSWKNNEVAYVDGCHSSKYLFGCCGMKKSTYSILNKQYSKEDYEEMVVKIKEQMKTMPYIDKRGIVYDYGEFFPSELSHFAYNESVANEFLPMAKDAAIKSGFNWEESSHLTQGKETLKLNQIPDSISEISGDILKEILACKDCSRNYRIIPRELELYKQMNVPIPRQCFYCRHKARFEFRNPYKLWQRKCMCEGSVSGAYKNTNTHFHEVSSCPNEFETSYAPNRPEVVYCEQCYNAEVV